MFSYRCRSGIGGKLKLNVEDTGSGMTKQDKERIFSRFYRGNRCWAGNVQS
ncbi:MAG: ATP-binding protein [Patescibacteria group bacterium]|nr:ATP-binding protein [Patescibacteria group bacterium]